MSLSDFVILAKIGEGAYSTVYKVKRISDSNIYALKKVKIIGLKQKEKENAVNQVRLLASITSDYIIKYKEAFFDAKSNTLCIVIQFADGGDLEKIIEKKKKTLSWVSQKEAWKIMKHLAAGLSILHQRNIIHRDLKSANIFISNETYKIADLNVSKLMKKDLAYTQTGTPYYASPEVWQDKPYEVKSDIWSLGCIIYELCALKPPFTANNMEGLYRKVMKGLYPKLPSTYSEKISKLIGKCLSLDPKKRPSAKDIIKFMDQSQDMESSSIKASTINLLNTIKIPKNLLSLKIQLPKSDYDSFSQKSTENGKNTERNNYYNNNKSRLKEIVRQKNQENYHKKQSVVVKNNPQSTDLMKQLESIKKNNMERYNHKKTQSKNQILPRIKLYSEPSQGYKVKNLISKLKQEEKRKEQYNRPSWWG